MVNSRLGSSKQVWAEDLQEPFISDQELHLYQAESIKTSLHFTFLQNQVKIQISSFSKLCYASYSPLHAEHIAIWIVLNGELCCDKSRFSFLCTNAFSLDLVWPWWIGENGCYIMFVFVLLKLLVWLLSSSGEIVLGRFWWRWWYPVCSWL